MMFVWAAVAAGCGSTTECPGGNIIGAELTCAGVPEGEICPSEACVVPTGCVEVSDDAAVSAALAGATPGSCILMAAGSYKAVDLPGGVSLFGRSAADVTVAGVIVDAGDNAVIRGLSVGAGGLTISPGATKVQVTSVRVSKSLSDGIQIGAGASVTVTATEVEDAGRYGIHAKDADATLEKVIVSRAEGPGLWAESTSCDAHCNCTPPREVQVARSILRDNRILGISTIGVSATLDSVDVTGTKSGDHFSYSQFGGGLSVSRCWTARTGASSSTTRAPCWAATTRRTTTRWSGTCGGSGCRTSPPTSATSRSTRS
jgi:hypothetical protein